MDNVDTAFSYENEDSVIKAALEILESRANYGDVVDSPKLAEKMFRLRLADSDCEIFSVAFLDSKNKLITVEDMFRGTIDAATIYPREVVKAALQHNAAALMFSHNHPSGLAEPSRADKAITDRLVKALGLVDIRVLDHFIVCRGETVSFAERGLL